ncbi:hypothetical protein ATCC90586_009235 [Pythium insidiosum]|nr:hypothetical protein ATCC90586_009235 [Pythium insidiosum]
MAIPPQDNVIERLLSFSSLGGQGLSLEELLQEQIQFTATIAASVSRTYPQGSIYNPDETAVYFDDSPGLIIAEKGTGKSTDGTELPPLIIFKAASGGSVEASFDDYPEGAVYAPHAPAIGVDHIGRQFTAEVEKQRDLQAQQLAALHAEVQLLEVASGKFILAVGQVWGVPARHFDVPNAYPRALSEEGIEIHLAVPEGMDITQSDLEEHGVTRKKELALKIEKNLYGLKQEGRLWHQLLVKTLLDVEYTQCITDACVFYKMDDGGITLVGAQATIKQIQNEATSSRQKHVDVKLKFLRDYYSKKIVRPTFIESAQMKADMLTKWMPRLRTLRDQVGLK